MAKKNKKNKKIAASPANFRDADFEGSPTRLVPGKDVWGYQIVSDDDEPKPGQTVAVTTQKGKQFVVTIEEVVSVREWDEHLIWKVRCRDDREFDYDGPSFCSLGKTTRTNKDGEEVSVTVWGIRVRTGDHDTGDAVVVQRQDGSDDTVYLLDKVKEIGSLSIFEMESERQRRIRQFNERKNADANADALDFE